MNLFICGPMTGYTDFNRAAFNEAEVELSKSRNKYSIMNPASLPDGLTQAEYMQITLQMVLACDAIVLLSGWNLSSGAIAEIALAKKLEKKFYTLIDGELLDESVDMVAMSELHPMYIGL